MRCVLSELADGQCGRVVSVQTGGTLGRRLSELGLIAGTKVCCVVHSPAGDPAAYLIRGAVVALRRADAAAVEVAP